MRDAPTPNNTFIRKIVTLAAAVIIGIIAIIWDWMNSGPPLSRDS